MREALVIAAAVIGLAFSLSGAVGILRMPDVYSRIQCSSKTITMGALPVLIALVIGKGPISSYGSRALLVAVLLLVVNPAASHALARAAYKTGVPMWPGAVTDEVRRQTGGSPPPRHELGAGERGADEPDADEPDADEPDADEPDADERGADERGADEPGADERGADERGREVGP